MDGRFGVWEGRRGGGMRGRGGGGGDRILSLARPRTSEMR